MFVKQYARFLVVVISVILSGAYCVAKNDDDVFVKCQFSKTSFFCQECVCATMWLYTVNPDVAYVNEINSPELKKGKFSYISRITDLPRPHREKVNGVDYIAIAISSYMIIMGDAGKYDMTGGKYEVGLNVPVVYDDPFYGRVRTLETRSRILCLPSVEFKVNELPSIAGDFPFSGAVGEFEVEAMIPPGDIIVNEDASVILIVKGKGMLGSDVLPEYREAFGNGNKLKSFTEHNKVFYDGKDIISEKELECEFVPTDINNCEIGVVRFGYFNPSTRRYEIAESEPIRINVKSSAVKIEPKYI